MTYEAPAPVTTQEIEEQTRALLALRAWADAFIHWYNEQQKEAASANDRPSTR